MQVDLVTASHFQLQFLISSLPLGDMLYIGAVRHKRVVPNSRPIEWIINSHFNVVLIRDVFERFSLLHEISHSTENQINQVAFNMRVAIFASHVENNKTSSLMHTDADGALEINHRSIQGCT